MQQMATAEPAGKSEKQRRRPRREQNRMQLTDLAIDRLNVKKALEMANRDLVRRGRKPSSQLQIWDTVQKGLSLLISAGGTKTFRSQFCLNGEWQSRTLGRFGEVVIEDGFEENANIAWARERVRKDRALAKQGIDPREQQSQPGAKTTYEAVVDQFIEEFAKPRQRTWEQTQAVLKRNCKPWLKKQFASITKHDAKRLLMEFKAEGHEAKAKLTYAWLKKLWKWAYAEDFVPAPVMDTVNIEFDVGERDRVYTDAEIKAIWKATAGLTAIEASYIKLLLLLAPRKSALAGMRRSHLGVIVTHEDGRRGIAPLNGDNTPAVWTTPHELTKSRKRTKNKDRVYLTPLPSLAVRILKPLIPKEDAETDLIFPGRGGVPLSATGPLKKKLVKAGAPADFDFHTARHTIATWLEDNGHDQFDRGLVLNHTGSGVTAGYSHGYALDRKRDLLTKWADHVESLVMPKGVQVLR